MSCLLKFDWVKLPRESLSEGKGLMGSWARLAARAAFRPGQADYCGHRNDVDLASWVEGVVGLKSILGINNRQKALDTMNALTEMGYISYEIEKGTKKLSYTVKDWVVDCSGAACVDGTIYATDGHGFLCLPRNITQRLVDANYKFEEGHALLLSEEIIDMRPYHGAGGEITWEYSEIRAWLNGEFLDRFSSEERMRIRQTNVINNPNPWFGTSSGNNTTDRAFLLSVEEVVRYFGDSAGYLATGRTKVIGHLMISTIPIALRAYRKR